MTEKYALLDKIVTCCVIMWGGPDEGLKKFICEAKY